MMHERQDFRDWVRKTVRELSRPDRAREPEALCDPFADPAVRNRVGHLIGRTAADPDNFVRRLRRRH